MMKKAILLLILVVFAAAALFLARETAGAGSTAIAEEGRIKSPAVKVIPEDIARLADTSIPRLYERSDAEIAELLRELAGLSLPQRVAALAFLQIGTPYLGGALGEETAPDTDPFLRYDVTDCTIMNLVSTALAHTGENEDPRTHIFIAGYRDPANPTFANRLHFTTDRLDVSPYFSDVTNQFPGTARRVTTLNRKKDGTPWIEIDWQRERTIDYLPAKKALELAPDSYPEIVGVAFLKNSKMPEGLDVLHEGLLYAGGTVVHGSLRAGQVIAEPLEVILARYDGIVLFEYR